jgi:hypothetical protein
MDGNSNQGTPRAREQGLVVRELDGELLIYDREHDVAHCLKGIQAAVWKNSDGVTPVADIVTVVGRQLGTPVDEYAVYRALADLSKNELLDHRTPDSREQDGMSRRDMMARTGLAAAAAIPVITSLMVPGSALAAGPCTQQGGTCTSSSQCCQNAHGFPGCCYKANATSTGVCGICSGGCCQVNSVCRSPVLFCTG